MKLTFTNTAMKKFDRVLSVFLKITLSTLFLSLFVSCQGIVDNSLEETPKSASADVFYNTPEEAEAAVNAIYSQWRTNNIPNYIVVLDTHTEWGYGRGSRAALNDFQGLNSTWINTTGSFWNTFYLSIRNANIVIENVPNGNSIGQEDIDRYVAEAKFLRALSYFHLVKNWEGVPLRTEDNMDEEDVGRSSVEEIYDLIISDLTEAELNLPEEQSQIGRATAFAAKTLLSHVYLNLEMFTEARDKAQEVIDSNKYSLVPVTTREDFNNIYGPDVTTTPEEIFYFKYARAQDQGNYMLWILNHPSTGLYNFGGAYAHYGDAADPFFQNWNDDDLRKDLWDQIDFGLGSTTLVSRKYQDQSAVSGHNAGNDQPVYRYAEILLIYAEAAARVAGGPTAEAMEALNKVHRRAYGEDPNTSSEIDYEMADYNEETFIDLVVEERGYEFIFEGKRWHTLKRLGIAEEYVQEGRGIIIAEKHYVWPIPDSEMNYNDAINSEDQNPGY